MLIRLNQQMTSYLNNAKFLNLIIRHLKKPSNFPEIKNNKKEEMQQIYQQYSPIMQKKCFLSLKAEPDYSQKKLWDFLKKR